VDCADPEQYISRHTTLHNRISLTPMQAGSGGASKVRGQSLENQFPRGSTSSHIRYVNPLYVSNADRSFFGVLTCVIVCSAKSNNKRGRKESLRLEPTSKPNQIQHRQACPKDKWFGCPSKLHASLPRRANQRGGSERGMPMRCC
jgi:hypothetical protein